jgi:PAS domain S-box-containing protein
MASSTETDRIPTGIEPDALGQVPPRMPGKWPLRFVVGSLVALALVPTLIGQRIRAEEEYVWEVLDPAANLNFDILRLHSRQKDQFDAYLTSGDPGRRAAYEELKVDADAKVAQLAKLLTPAPGDTTARARELYQHVTAMNAVTGLWHVGHQLVFKGELARHAYLVDGQTEDDQRFEDVLSSEQALTTALVGEMGIARAQMSRVRDLQVRITGALAALALLATAAAGLVGVRLRSLVSETEARRREAAGARREIAATLAATGDGVLGFDLAGRCTMLNATGARLLKISEADALGRTVHDLLHGAAPEAERHSRHDCPIFEAIRSGAREREREEVFWRGDGSSFLGKWQFRPLKDGKVVPGGVLTLTDMTEIRQAEEALKQAVHDRDQVVAVVSHDLRNPLGTILAASELLVEVELPESKRDDQLRIIRRASRRMSRLLEDLLDVSRIEAGGLTVDPEPIDLEPLLREAVELHLPLVEESGVELGSELEANLPLVLADHERILQVLSNLIGNAFKHTKRDGRVTVTARRDGDVVVLSVIDTGEGIAAQDLERLFDRFWQARMRGRSGAGLGLAIVKGIVEAHRGRVWVESVPEEGSAFHFTLPVVLEDSRPNSAVPGSVARGAWLRRNRAGA